VYYGGNIVWLFLPGPPETVCQFLLNYRKVTCVKAKSATVSLSTLCSVGWNSCTRQHVVLRVCTNTCCVEQITELFVELVLRRGMPHIYDVRTEDTKQKMLATKNVCLRVLISIDIAVDIQLELCHRCSMEWRIYPEFPRGNQLLLGRRRLNVTESDFDDSDQSFRGHWRYLLHDDTNTSRIIDSTRWHTLWWQCRQADNELVWRFWRH